MGLVRAGNNGRLRDYGFNPVAWANNYTLDYSYGGLDATEYYLNTAWLCDAGAEKISKPQERHGISTPQEEKPR